MTVRMFGGWDFKHGDDRRSDLVAFGYQKGVPMGGELQGDPEAAAVRTAFREGKTAKSETLSFLGYVANPQEGDKAYVGIAAEVAKQIKSPTFIVAAQRDPMGANLDRVQMIKGWRDSKANCTNRFTTSLGETPRAARLALTARFHLSAIR